MPKIIAEGLTEQELQELRDAQQTFQAGDFIIRRREFFPPDDYDHRATVGDGIQGRLTAGFGQFRNIADRFQGITPFTFTVSWDQDIRADDEVLDNRGNIFHVRDVRKGNTYQSAIQCLVDLVTDHG